MAATPTSDELDAWVRATAPRAIAYARSLLKHPEDAEDIVHDCYCRLLAKKSEYDLLADGQRILLRAVTNACINLRTRRRVFFRLVREDDETFDDPPDNTALPAEAHAVHAELSGAVGEALRKLPAQQRAAIQLKSLGHSQEEIGEILGVSASNAGVLVFRARQTLAKLLANYLGEEAT